MAGSNEKAQRLLQIEQMLWAHPEGLTRAEIARRLGVNRSTITKYLNHDQLPTSIYEDDLDGYKLKLDPDTDLGRTAFTLNEIMAIHLATRLLATRSDRQNPHAASALRKLSRTLDRLDHNISSHLLRSADSMDQDPAARDPVYLAALETLTRAWSAGRVVLLNYHQADGTVSSYRMAPYFIEPYAVGQTAHVIGLREPPGLIRTLKVERVGKIELTHDRYEIPAGFDPDRMLRDAWGIWTSDNPPEEVRLRFSPRVAVRVRETRWHSSQVLEAAPDGGVLWRGLIAEWREMLPWIRGWGADCEVLAPIELRRELTEEARRLRGVYGV